MTTIVVSEKISKALGRGADALGEEKGRSYSKNDMIGCLIDFYIEHGSDNLLIDALRGQRRIDAGKKEAA